MDFNIEWFDRLASTNIAMRDRFSQDLEIRNGQIIATREQTAGRGRQARKWLSAPGQNLCFSLFIQTDAELMAVPSITMATALAVNDLLRGIGIQSAPKWPNDVLVDGRKICGILSERVERKKNRKRLKHSLARYFPAENYQSHGSWPSLHSGETLLHQTQCRIASPTSGRKAIHRQSPAGEKSSAAGGGTKDELVTTGIIVGIGLNVNMSSKEAEAIDRPATSIRIESGQTADLSQTLGALLHPLEYWIGEWEKGGFSTLREAWTAKAGPIGKPLSVHDGATRKTGTLAGFGDHGELLLKTENGLETIWSGDVS